MRAWLASAAAVLLASVALGALLSTPGGGAVALDLVVSPHPDDELLAWAALEDDPQTYTVLVTLTRGEATRNCDRARERTQVGAGERLPDPVPTPGNVGTCQEARVDSWRAFLAGAAEVTPEVALGGDRQRHSLTGDRLGGTAEVWAGTNAAYVLLSLPDGGLTEAGVVGAVEAVLAQRGAALPDLPLRRIVAASYWNDSAERGTRTLTAGDCAVSHDCPGDPAAAEYENLDHRETSAAMVPLAQRAELGAWVTVPQGESQALVAALGAPVKVTWRELSLSPEDYKAFMGLGEQTAQGPERLGLQQVVYGWLAFPGQWWAAGEDTRAGDVLFARRQTFLLLPGGAP